MNESDRKVYASFSNPDPGSSSYSYMSMQAPDNSFTVGKIYTFSVDAEGEDMADMGNKDKMAMQ